MKTIILSLIFLTVMTFGQMNDLHIMPRHLMYRHSFDRVKHLVIENRSSQIINIDSIKTNDRFIVIQFRENVDFPVSLNPNDKLIMDVFLDNIEILTNSDTTQTIKIFNSSSKPLEEISVSTGFYNMDHKKGYINGSVTTDGGSPISEAKVYFFMRGMRLIDSVLTDENGFYTKQLSYSKYLISAHKDGFYMEYFGDKEEILLADFVELNKDSVKYIDFTLQEETVSGLSISGIVFAAKTETAKSSKIVIVKKGKHTPSKIRSSEVDTVDDKSAYVAFVKSDGSYLIENIRKEDNYIVQVFSDRYLPGFYHSSMQPTIDPNKAENIYVNSFITGIDIHLESDSAFGGGFISGSVEFGSVADNPKDVLVYAKSLINEKHIGYSFVDNFGKFEISNLPYARYKLIAHKTDYNSTVSDEIVIDSGNTNIQNVKVTFSITSIENEKELPKDFYLSQNYPNPFNSTTQINYSLPQKAIVKLSVYNTLGQNFVTIVDELQDKGVYRINFDAGNLPSGIYYYKLKAGKYIKTLKMVLIK